MTVSVAPEENRNIWSHSQHMRELYTARARQDVEEMDCAVQAVSLLGEVAKAGDIILDVGAGSGWFYHSLRTRGLDLEYWGVDQTEAFIEIGRRELEPYGLPPERLQVGKIEDVEAQVDHVVCLNVLSNIPNWHLAMDRMAMIARRTIILRESLGDSSSYLLVHDRYLDPPHTLMVHVNTYSTHEIIDFLRERGFRTQEHVDSRTRGMPEMVIDHPHYWRFLVAKRVDAA